MLFTEERIGQVLNVLKEQTIIRRQPVGSYRQLDVPASERVAYPPKDGRWLPYDPASTPWQGDDSYAWFSCEVVIPQSMDGLPVYFAQQTGREGWDALNPQFMAYVNGQPVQGLDVNHRELLLSEQATAGTVYSIMLSAYSGLGRGDLSLQGELHAVDRQTEALYWDLKIPLDIARLLPHDGAERTVLLKACNEAVNRLDLRVLGSEGYAASVLAAREYLESELFDRQGGDKVPKLYCVGHTHIDLAWWWTLKVTEDKAVRSFSTVLELMRQYPEYLFMSSQPQLYKYVQRNAPQVYEQIRQAVLDNRWEPEGAMFVEADCNLSGGEALVRQILHGKRFFRQEFDRDNEILWLPDVFGYSAAMPQILIKSGIRYFMTTKISWNEFNKFPMDTFMWQGIDGTRVLTHFSPSRDYNRGTPVQGEHAPHFTTYNADLGANQVMGAWQRYQQKDISDMALMSFGFGDGGGGPTRGMLESYKRLKRGLPGCPQAVMSDSRTFFRDLEAEVGNNPRLPRWVGEMYLEYHRGTYTSMARNKRYNRKAEFAWINNELYSTLAESWMNRPYPQQHINQAWEVIERNQFHDILPGSSIKQVYEDSKEEYEALIVQSDRLQGDALQVLTDGVAGEAGDLVVFNPNSFEHNGVVAFAPHGDARPQVMDGGNPLPTQYGADGQGVFRGGAIPPKGYKRFRLAGAADSTQATARIEGRRFETAFYVLEFHEDMSIARLYDKTACREVFRPCERANRLMSYEDRPHNYDAWDLNHYYTEHAWPIDQVEGWDVTENGPVRTVVEIRRRYLSSTILQQVILYADDRRIDIHNDWDWKESHIFVKALFPVDVLATEATYEIQFGHVKRPTHYNTSWDFARFEVCHHKWMDLSEEGYGLSVLNDCKYGVSAHDGMIGLSLLKSATLPNPDADKERHTFTYALLPHLDTWREAGVLQSAYALNNPPVACLKQNARGSLPAAQSFAAADQPNVVIEAVKLAEEGAGTILRVYEAWGRRTEAALRLALPLEQVSECNLMEEDDQVLPHEDGSFRFTLKPFEIKTFKAFFAGR